MNGLLRSKILNKFMLSSRGNLIEEKLQSHVHIRNQSAENWVPVRKEVLQTQQGITKMTIRQAG